MTANNLTSQYALGSTEAEHERLICQAAWLTVHWHCATSCPRTAPHPAEAGKRAEQRQRHAG